MAARYITAVIVAESLCMVCNKAIIVSRSMTVMEHSSITATLRVEALSDDMPESIFYNNRNQSFFSFLPNIEKCTYLFGFSFRSFKSAFAASHVVVSLW